MEFIVKRTLKGTKQKDSFFQIRDLASTPSSLNSTLPTGRSARTSRARIPICRQAVTTEGSLPEAIRTDPGTCFVGADRHRFPSDFTRSWWGLGVAHELIAVRRPAQHGGRERDPRTFGEQFLEDSQFDSHPQLEQDAESFGQFQNQEVPSRSGRCQGGAADQTAAKLKGQARPSKPAQEAKLCSVDRIYAQRSEQRWPRLVSTNGQLTLGHDASDVGWGLNHQEIEVRFDLQSKEVFFCSSDQVESKRWPIRGISDEEIVKEQNPALKDQSPRRSRKREC